MKRLYLIFVLFLILSPSTSSGGSFYNPDSEELKEKGRKAAEKLNTSFVSFYQMLENIEGNKFQVAKDKKNDFDSLLKKDVLPIFSEIHEIATDKKLPEKFPPGLESNLRWIEKNYYNNEKIDTQKKLTELPIILIRRLSEESGGFKIEPKNKDFFPKLRSLIIVAIDVQWVGVKVSELWLIAN